MVWNWIEHPAVVNPIGNDHLFLGKNEYLYESIRDERIVKLTESKYRELPIGRRSELHGTA